MNILPLTSSGWVLRKFSKDRRRAIPSLLFMCRINSVFVNCPAVVKVSEFTRMWPPQRHPDESENASKFESCPYICVLVWASCFHLAGWCLVSATCLVRRARCLWVRLILCGLYVVIAGGTGFVIVFGIVRVCTVLLVGRLLPCFCICLHIFRVLLVCTCFPRVFLRLKGWVCRLWVLVRKICSLLNLWLSLKTVVFVQGLKWTLLYLWSSLLCIIPCIGCSIHDLLNQVVSVLICVDSVCCWW